MIRIRNWIISHCSVTLDLHGDLMWECETQSQRLVRSENVSTENCGASFPGLVCHTVLSHWVSNTVCHSAATTRDNLYRTGGLYHSLIHEGHPSVLAQSVAWKISRMWKDPIYVSQQSVTSLILQKSVFPDDCNNIMTMKNINHWSLAL